MFEYEGIKIHWLGHDAFWIEAKGKNIYIDPFKLGKTNLPTADIVITSHEHFDHCNADSINMISGEKSVLIGPKITQEILNEQVVVKDAKKCIVCKACEIQCPQQAITVKEKPEAKE